MLRAIYLLGLSLTLAASVAHAEPTLPSPAPTTKSGVLDKLLGSKGAPLEVKPGASIASDTTFATIAEGKTAVWRVRRPGGSLGAEVLCSAAREPVIEPGAMVMNTDMMVGFSKARAIKPSDGKDAAVIGVVSPDREKLRYTLSINAVPQKSGSVLRVDGQDVTVQAALPMVNATNNGVIEDEAAFAKRLGSGRMASVSLAGQTIDLPAKPLSDVLKAINACLDGAAKSGAR